MTKFEIKNGKLFLKERKNKDELMLESSYSRTDLRTEIKDVKKIFDNPVTAIAYDDETRQYNCEMDKISLLKALDFWINDKVLQNEKILFLEGNLKDVHEIELKKLIDLREFVQKQPNDTVFTRFRGDEKTHRFEKHSSWNVEFFVKKEKLMADGLLSTYASGTSTYNFNNNFRDDGARFNFNGLWDAVPTPEDSRPLQMGDTVVFDRVSNSFRRANDNDTQRIRLTNEDQSPEFLRWVLTGTFVIPGDNMHLMPGEMLSINNDNENIMLVNAPVADELHSGDIITLVTLNGESRWRKVEGSGPDHLLHSNLHPGIPPSSTDNDTLFTSTLVMADRTQNIRTTRDGLEHLQNMTLRSTRMIFEDMRVAEADISISTSYQVTLKLIGEGGSLDLIFQNTSERLFQMANEGNESVRVELLGDNEVMLNSDLYRLRDISGAVTFRHNRFNPSAILRDLFTNRPREEPQHPSLPTFQAPSNNNNNNNQIQGITFENLIMSQRSEDMFFGGDDSYTNTHIALANSQYEIQLELMVNESQLNMLHIPFGSFGRLRIQDDTYVRFNDVQLRYIDYTIRERIVNAGESFVPRSFHDMYIHSAESSRSETSIGGSWTRWMHKLVLRSADNKIELELNLRDSTNTFQSVTQRLRRQAVNIGILTDRTITINGYSYRNEYPPEVTYSSR